jgi:hypothetical protein
MALKLNGKDNHIMLKDFRQLARTLDVPVESTAELVAELACAVQDAARTVVLPKATLSKDADDAIERVQVITRVSAEAFRCVSQASLTASVARLSLSA